MLFPESVIDKFEQTFYDKEIALKTVSESQDADGGLVRTISSTRSTFMGNVRFSNLGEIMTDLGLTENIDVCITCKTNVAVSLNDLASYNGKIYQITSVIPSDTHKTLIGKLWPEQ